MWNKQKLTNMFCNYDFDIHQCHIATGIKFLIKFVSINFTRSFKKTLMHIIYLHDQAVLEKRSKKLKYDIYGRGLEKQKYLICNPDHINVYVPMSQ